MIVVADLIGSHQDHLPASLALGAKRRVTQNAPEEVGGEIGLILRQA
jgi:hypothetical protein